MSELCEQIGCSNQITFRIVVEIGVYMVKDYKNLNICTEHYEEWLIKELDSRGYSVVKN